jgi:hypothetical protein
MTRALPTAARHQEGEEEDIDAKPAGCRRGITRTGLPPPEADVASSPELFDA